MGRAPGSPGCDWPYRRLCEVHVQVHVLFLRLVFFLVLLVSQGVLCSQRHEPSSSHITIDSITRVIVLLETTVLVISYGPPRTWKGKGEDG